MIFLLQQLKEKVIAYKDLLAGAEDELEHLKDDLLLFKDFLEFSEKKQVPRQMKRKIRELVYVVQDTIEICLAKETAARDKSLLIRLVRKNNINQAQQVNLLRQRKVKPVVDEIKEIWKTELGQNTGESSEQPRPVKFSSWRYIL